MTTDILRSGLRGALITALEPRLAAESDALIWNGRKPARRVKLIVRAACAEDVAEAVRFAAAKGLTVSPRGGGHQFTGIAAQADMVIDLGTLDGLKLDAEARTARVEPAVTNARLAAALERHGLAFPLSHCGSVPMSGYLLGGGVGWNSAEWGFACFSVMAVEVVLADGRIVTADAEQNADIYWAVRGAGPEFFGVVTAYHVKLQEAAKATSTSIRIYPAAMASQVADWAETVMAEAPPSVEFKTKVKPTRTAQCSPPWRPSSRRRMPKPVRSTPRLGKSAHRAAQVMPHPKPIGASTRKQSRPLQGPTLRRRTRSGPKPASGEVLGAPRHGMATRPSEESMAWSLRPERRRKPRWTPAFHATRRVSGAHGIWQGEEHDAANIGWPGHDPTVSRHPLSPPEPTWRGRSRPAGPAPCGR